MPTRPNVLWIFSDQHRPQAMSCAGDPNIDTPHLDRLAAQGTRFTNAYSTCPLCSPFRACLYTGQYIHTHGVISLFRPLLPANQPVLPELLQRHGYHTSHMGKWHLSGGDAPCPFVSPYFRPGWDDWLGWENSNDFFNTIYTAGDHPSPVLTLPRYQTDAVTDLTVQWLREHADTSPWFHVVSIEPPHNGILGRSDYSTNFAPEPYMDMFRDRPIEFRPNFAHDHPRRDQYERDLRGYYAQIKNLDDNIGRMMTALEETGQLDRTLVMYFADHGDMMGSHGRRQKSRPEEESAAIPLIARCPGLIPAGEVSDALLGAVDLMPTLLGLLGAPIPDSVQGDDLSDLFRGTRHDGVETVLIQYDRPYFPPSPDSTFRAIRHGQWLYSVFLTRGPTQLFDLQQDPFELHNLIDSPDHARLRDELHARLGAKLKEVNDNFPLADI